MKYLAYILILGVLSCWIACGPVEKTSFSQDYVLIPWKNQVEVHTIPFDSLQTSDPFIFADRETQMYYLVCSGGTMWKSRNLSEWTGPYAFLEVDTLSWIGKNPWIWAPQLHQYKDKYYCFVTFTNPELIVDTVPDRYKVQRRATKILVSEKVDGPYRPLTEQEYFPKKWSVNDGTLWVENETPYMVFGHGWMQTVDGQINFVQLSSDLSQTVGEFSRMFQASEASWSRDMQEIGELTFGMMLDGHAADGPFLFRTGTGKLGMLWSGWGEKRCAQGVAYSQSGSLSGPWLQVKEPLVADNSGHAMLFHTFDGKQLMLLHHQSLDMRNPGPRRPLLLEVDTSGDELKILRRYEPSSNRVD